MSHDHDAMMTVTVDGQEVTVPHGTTVFDAARIAGIPIPTLCHQQNQTPIAVCRICVVDVGERALQAACIHKAEPGMVVKTSNESILQARKTLYELMLSDHPSPCRRQQQSGDCELEMQAKAAGVTEVRFNKRAVPVLASDDSSPAIHVDFSACILCDRCIRGCAEIRHNFVIARQGKGYFTTIGFDANQPMGNSSCVSCGECMISCPTGALTNKRELGAGRLYPEDTPNVYSVETEELLALPVFKGVSGTFLELNTGSVVKRIFEPGEIIVREGENGSTAFYMLEGDVDIYINAPREHVTTEAASGGFFTKMRSLLIPKTRHRREEERETPAYIHIDAPEDLPYDNPVAQLHAGDLFGEMTCMNFYPRSATVRARNRVVVLEMLRNVLDVMQKNKTFRAQLEANYRGRALSTHLRSVPIFANIDEEFVDLLRDRVELLRFAPGQVICEEGAPADAFYLVRIGFVKVSQKRGGEELVLAYLPRGGYFGEMGLLQTGIRNATCVALDHVEVVRILAPDFHEMLKRFPEVRAHIEHVAAQRARDNSLLQRRPDMAMKNAPLHQFLEQGLMEAQSLLVLDLEKCTRCDQCVKACADAHGGVTRLLRDGVRFENYLVPTSCRQCRDPRCMIGCPVGSIRRRSGTLEVIIEDWCVGCGLCASNCPYGNITVHEFDKSGNATALQSVQTDKDTGNTNKVRKATSCDLCHDLAEPSCVYACPHDAAHRVKPNEFFVNVLGVDLDQEAAFIGKNR
jgi:CRP-like cAMP-binding protein/Fe-S-cluster-containing hydrogenase component 2